MTTTFRYRPAPAGGHLLATSAGRLVLVATETGEVPTDALLAALAESEPVAAVVGLLTGRGLASTPEFAIVVPESATDVRCVVRGQVTVAVTTGDGSVDLDGSDVSTWREDRVSGVVRLEVRTAQAETDASVDLPLASGAAWASAVVVETDGQTGADADAGADSASDVDAAAVPVAVSAVAPAAASPVTPATPVTPVIPDEPDEPDEPGEVDDTVFVTPRPAPVGSGSDDAAESDDGTDTDAADEIDDDSDDDDDGAVDPGLEQTMVEPPEGHDDEPVAASAQSAPAAPSAPAPTAVPDLDDDAIESTVVRPVTASDLPTAATPTLTTVGDELGDHDGMTVMRDDLDELRAKSQPVSESTIEPVPVIEAAPRYELVFASGSVETLDQPIVIGRAPTVAKESAGALPRLIAISDDQDVSRTHVRFTVEGDSVVVTDLNSRNGTVVTLPGAPPQQLRGGEPTTVLTGTSVDLGGGVVISVREGS